MNKKSTFNQLFDLPVERREKIIVMCGKTNVNIVADNFLYELMEIKSIFGFFFVIVHRDSEFIFNRKTFESWILQLFENQRH